MYILYFYNLSYIFNMSRAAALNQAIKRSDLNRIKEILDGPECSVVINAEDGFKYTPIFYACMHQDQKFGLKVVELLLEKGANPLHYDINLQSVIYYLCKDGKMQILKELFPRFQYDINHPDYVKQTPLFFATSNNHKQVAQYLLKHKADVNHIDNNGQNCIFYAASNGHLDMCKLLVNRQANFQLVDYNKDTPIHYARKKKNRAIVEYFNGLKNNLKHKQITSRMESSHQESRGPSRKKKELLKQEFCLVFTNQRGQIRELTMEDLQKFGEASQQNHKILELIKNPELLDSMTFPDEKKFQKIANKILTHFVKHEQGIHFAQPLDIIALNILNYPTIVKNPMDFSTIRTKLNFNAYDTENDFYADMNLVFDNCILFNGKESAYGKIAAQMKLQFNTMYRKQFGL